MLNAKNIDSKQKLDIKYGKKKNIEYYLMNQALNYKKEKEKKKEEKKEEEKSGKKKEPIKKTEKGFIKTNEKNDNTMMSKKRK